MPSIFLLISDSALREAVVEQLASSKLGALRVVNTLRDVECGEKPCVVIVDEAAFDGNAVASFNVGEKKPLLLLLVHIFLKKIYTNHLYFFVKFIKRINSFLEFFL